MNKEEQEKLVQQFLDGDLDPSQEKVALQLMVEDSELREMLHFEIYLNRVFRRQEAEAQSFTVPEGFSDQVMESVQQREQQTREAEEKAQSPGVYDRIKEGLDILLQPRTVQWKPAHGLAAVIAVLAVIIALNIGTQNQQVPQETAQQASQSQAEEQIKNQQAVQVTSMSTEEPDQVWARFFYVNNEAESVAVAGDFSNWEPIPLDKKDVNGNKVWTSSIQMEKGEHRYMYIINGEKWKTDPLATRYKEDGFGHRNAVISL